MIDQAYQQLKNELMALKKNPNLQKYSVLVVSDLVNQVAALTDRIAELERIADRKKPGPKPKGLSDAIKEG